MRIIEDKNKNEKLQSKVNVIDKPIEDETKNLSENGYELSRTT